MESVGELLAVVLEAWSTTAHYIASGHEHEFIGRYKERDLVRRLRSEVEDRAAGLRIVGPDVQDTFRRWRIDLVCGFASTKLAVEVKFKTQRDGAVPDNRKAAFFDLFKLEQYVTSGEYAGGLFLWLTDHERYRSTATGDSANFSTHHGRVYSAGTSLQAARSRDASMPNPLRLDQSYRFEWTRVRPSATWFSLVIPVVGGAA